MSFEMRLDDGSPESKDWVWLLGSAQAVTELTDWIGTLPPEFKKLHEFAKALTVKDTMQLSVELSIALDEYAPPEGAKATANLMLEHIEEGDEDETLIVGEDTADDG